MAGFFIEVSSPDEDQATCLLVDWDFFCFFAAPMGLAAGEVVVGVAAVAVGAATAVAASLAIAPIDKAAKIAAVISFFIEVSKKYVERQASLDWPEPRPPRNTFILD